MKPDKILKLDVFNYEFKVHFGLLKPIEEEYNLTDTTDYDGFCCEIKPGHGIIAIEKQELGVIVHECVHAANQVLNFIGHKVDGDNDEIQAYLTQYIFEQIHD